MLCGPYQPAQLTARRVAEAQTAAGHDAPDVQTLLEAGSAMVRGRPAVWAGQVRQLRYRPASAVDCVGIPIFPIHTYQEKPYVQIRR